VKSKVKNKGFTLIELIIAMLIFSIVAVAIYSTFSTGLIAWRKGEESSRSYQNARLILNKMALELRNAFFYSNIKFVGKANELYFATFLPFSSVPGIDHQLQLYRVAYHLDNNHSLQRQEESLPEVFQGKEEKAQEFSSSVRELSFAYGYEYYGEGKKEPQFIWKDEWTDKEAVPSLVRITLTLEGNSGTPEGITFVRTVYLPTGIIGIEEE